MTRPSLQMLFQLLEERVYKLYFRWRCSSFGLWRGVILQERYDVSGYSMDPNLRLDENNDPWGLQHQFHRGESLISHIFSLVVAQRWGWVPWCSGLLYQLQMAHEYKASVERLVENKLAAQREVCPTATGSAMKCNPLRWNWSRQITAWTMNCQHFSRVFRYVGLKSGLSVRKWLPAAGYFVNDYGTLVS